VKRSAHSRNPLYGCPGMPMMLAIQVSHPFAQDAKEWGTLS